MLIRFLSGFFYLLGNILALALVVLILLPQTVPFGDDREVEVKIYKATFLKWPFKPGNVEAVMGPCTEIITADDTIWEAQWKRIYTDELDLVEVTWYIHVDNDSILTLRLKRIKTSAIRLGVDEGDAVRILQKLAGNDESEDEGRCC